MAGTDAVYAQQSAGSHLSDYRKPFSIGTSHPTPAILRYAVRRSIAYQCLRRDALFGIGLYSIICFVAWRYNGIN